MKRAPLIALLVSCAGAPSPPPSSTSAQPAADGRMGVHGMILFGERRFFVSHIPMFRRPHDAQVILEVELSAKEPKTFSDALYTVEPERFALDALVRGEKKSFAGTIFKGSFEDGGTPLVKDVSFTVKRVVVARYLTGEDAGALGAYLLFGDPADAYLARRIGKAPGIDEIARATVTGGGFVNDARLARGIEVTLEGRDAAPLKAAESFRAATSEGVVAVTTGAVLSCLAGPDFDKPCPK